MGSGTFDFGLSTREAPHAPQNLALGRSSEPQLAHARCTGAAHSSQNFAPGRLSWLQTGQRIVRRLARAARHEPSLIAAAIHDVYDSYMRLAADPGTERWLVGWTGAEQEFDMEPAGASFFKASSAT